MNKINSIVLASMLMANFFACADHNENNLEYAITNQNLPLINRLIASDVVKLDNDLLDAVEKGDLEKIHLSLKKGANPHWRRVIEALLLSPQEDPDAFVMLACFDATIVESIQKHALFENLSEHKKGALEKAATIKTANPSRTCEDCESIYKKLQQELMNLSKLGGCLPHKKFSQEAGKKFGDQTLL